VRGHRLLAVCAVVLFSVVGFAQVAGVFTQKSYEYLDGVVSAIEFYLVDPSNAGRQELADFQLMMVWALAQDNYRQAATTAWEEDDKFRTLAVAYSAVAADLARRGVQKQDRARCEAALILAADAKAFVQGVWSQQFVP